MYNNDTRESYSKLIEYIESKYDSIKSNEDFKEKFQDLLDNDEDFQKMLNDFNEKSVYNEDRVNTVEDFLSLQDKIFPKSSVDKKDDSEDIVYSDRIENKEKNVKKETNINNNKSNVPFYKKVVNAWNSMPTSLQIANASSLIAFGTLTLLNSIGGGGLFYVGATIGLPIPAMTATYYLGKAIYKSYKNGKIRNWLNKRSKNIEPLPNEFAKSKDINLEPSKVESKEVEKEFMPFGGDVEKAMASKSKKDNKADIREIKPEPIDVPPVPVFEKSTREPLPRTDTRYATVSDIDKRNDRLNRLYDRVLKDNEQNAIDAIELPMLEEGKDAEVEEQVVGSPEMNIEIKEDNQPKKIGRHVKKNMQNLEDGYKERRISELERQIEQDKVSLTTLNANPIYEEDEAKKTTAANAIKRINENLEKNTKELNELKGTKSEGDLYQLLIDKKKKLSKKLTRIQDKPENKELISHIKGAIGQIDRYINLSNQLRNNALATDADMKRLEQMESATYTTIEFVLDETKDTRKRSK